MTWRECADAILKKYYADTDQIVPDDENNESSKDEKSKPKDNYVPLEDSIKKKTSKEQNKSKIISGFSHG